MASGFKLYAYFWLPTVVVVYETFRPVFTAGIVAFGFFMKILSGIFSGGPVINGRVVYFLNL